MAEIQFLGAARTVTGSKYLVTAGETKVMIDCGLFQGLKELRQRNWQPLPLDPAEIDAVVLTHAHIDHTGYLPRLVRDGFQGPVYASRGTAALCKILLPDSGRLQEEDARYANKHGFSKHKPALPLYTEKDARAALRLLHSLHYDEPVRIAPGFSFQFISAGHILGSSFVYLTITEAGEQTRIIFSGDLGRYNVPILTDPTPVAEADYIVVESTYGDRRHENINVKEQLAEIITRTAARGGSVIIPAFAVGRTQEILYYLRELENEERIPILPVVIDSPMAKYATQTYMHSPEDHDEEMKELINEHINPLATRSFMLTSESAKAVKERRPAIIVSASGMATGGRVLHHLKDYLPDARATVLFVGYQAEGTRGRRLLNGEKEIKIHGEMIPVNAEIASISGLSAHADYEEILRWLGEFRTAPRHLFITHGEPAAAAALKEKIEAKFGWPVSVPEYLARVTLA